MEACITINFLTSVVLVWLYRKLNVFIKIHTEIFGVYIKVFRGYRISYQSLSQMVQNEEACPTILLTSLQDFNYFKVKE